ncbi:MAG TPA: helix-turn-helix domain-containing protein [Gammaproteobacteria bacterium]|nr:helix-turn-helix domain-containing protein [Gammaproteobacteria bacterium]
MRGYGQFCPVAKASEILAERWTPLVLRELLCGSRHFNDLRRGVPLMSPSLLSKRLKELEGAGIIDRLEADNGQTEYRLTPAGRELRPIIMQLGEWGLRWVRQRFGNNDLDPAVLMWDLRRRAHPEAFPPGLTVVKFEISDVPAGKRDWWVLSGPEGVDVCISDPGFEPSLYVAAPMAMLARVWLGDCSLTKAVESGNLRLTGAAQLKRRLRAWLGLSVFASTPRPRV